MPTVVRRHFGRLIGRWRKLSFYMGRLTTAGMQAGVVGAKCSTTEPERHMSKVGDILGGDSQWLAIAVVGGVAILGYMLSRLRGGQRELTLLDALIVAVAVAVVAAAGIPLIEAMNRHIEHAALLENLHTLRRQIERYKLDHDGRPPVLHEGSLPQLIYATNREGLPGPPGSKYPHGPYLPAGIPLNPVTGRSVVTATEVFPPEQPSGNGGWLYHEPTGQIAPDLEGFLDK